MPDPDFNGLREQLLQAGIAPAHARRASREMREHYEDLVEEFREAGLSREASLRRANEAFGRSEDIVAAMSACRELKTWAFRYPRAAVLFYPLACLVALPAVPVVAGVNHAPLLARWGASLLVAGVFTAALLLILQLSILFG